MPTRPTEPPAGQDEPPDVRTAVVVMIRLLADMRKQLEPDERHHELVLRGIATRRALLRLLRKIDREP